MDDTKCTVSKMYLWLYIICYSFLKGAQAPFLILNQLVMRLFFLFSILFLYSCKTPEKAYLTKGDDIRISISESHSNTINDIYHFNYNNRDVISYTALNLENKVTDLFFYDLKSKKNIQNINFNKEKGYSKSIQGCFFKDNNEIVSSSFLNDSLYFSDFNGKINRKFLLRHEDLEKKINISGLTPSFNKPFILKETKVFLSPFLYYVNKESLKDAPIFYSFDISKNKFERENVFFPAEYLNSEYFNNEFSYCFDGKNIVISPSHSNDIWITDLSFKSLKISKEAKSDNFRKFLVTGKRPKDMQEALHNKCTNSYYYGIYYDKYKEVYYRVLMPGRDMKINDKNLVNEDTFPKTICIIILDKSLNKIGETCFEDNEFTPNFFITPEGLYIDSNNPEKKGFIEGVVKYTKLILNYD